jgi:hypothetical protein
MSQRAGNTCSAYSCWPQSRALNPWTIDSVRALLDAEYGVDRRPADDDTGEQLALLVGLDLVDARAQFDDLGEDLLGVVPLRVVLGVCWQGRRGEQGGTSQDRGQSLHHFRSFESGMGESVCRRRHAVRGSAFTSPW